MYREPRFKNFLTVKEFLSPFLMLFQVVFEDTYYARDSGTLEQLKELTTRRKSIEDFLNGSNQLTPAIAREMAGGISSPVLQVYWSTF